ncbi:MAG: inner membrane protein YpjD [Mycobacterium leprae]
MPLYLELILAGGAALYTLVAIAHLFYIFRRDFDTVARWSTRLAWLVQTVGLILLLVTTGRAPFHTLFENAYFFSWLVATAYVILEFFRHDQTAGSFLMPVVAVIQIADAALPKPSSEHHLMALPTSLVGWHIGVTGLGYGFLLAAFVSGALYLLQDYQLRMKRWAPVYYRLPSLESLDIWGARFIYIGFTLMTIGVGAGLIFAQLIWQRFWEIDPKVLSTVLVWLVYGLYLLMRKVWGWGGRKSAWWAVVGAGCLLVNYFIMDMFSRIHRFGA